MSSEGTESQIAAEPDPDDSGKTAGNDAPKTGRFKTLPKTQYIGLIILSIITFLGLLTVYLLALLVPSEIELAIKKAGTTVTIVGGAGLFLILWKMYLSAYTKIVQVLVTLAACFVILLALVTTLKERSGPIPGTKPK